MAFKFATLRNTEGFSAAFSFHSKRIYKNELEILASIFLFRWGVQAHYGPKYLVG